MVMGRVCGVTLSGKAMTSFSKGYSITLFVMFCGVTVYITIHML